MIAKKASLKWLLACSVVFSSMLWAVEPLTGSENIHSSKTQVKDHRVILGALERIKGAMRPESEIRVGGRLQQDMWQAPIGHSQVEAFNFVVNALNKSAVTLFECEGRQCGLSNDFANQVFQQRLLYGRDSDQLYWVGYEAGKQPVLWVVYGIQRSNKRAYTFVESIKVNSSSVKAIQPFFQKGQIQQFLQVGYRVIKPLEASVPAQLELGEVDWLTELLRDYPNKKFAVVVHRYGDQDPLGLLERTKAEADSLVTQVADAGGFIQNLYRFGAGSMMPRAGDGDRVELVELK